MPYEWKPETGTPDAPLARVTLWPHRSLTAEGFVWFVGLTAVGISLPLIAVIGSPVLWGLLPFAVLTVCGIWWAIRRNARDGTLTEDLVIWRDRMRLVRREPRGTELEWSADPYWVQVEMHREGGPVENYVTLKGGGREVEIGAFLSPEERVALRDELVAALAKVR